MGTELANSRELTPDMWQMISAVAPTMHDARLFDTKGPEEAAAIMLKGYELGLSLSGSFEFVHVIQGKPALSPRGALALILQHPECAGVEIVDGDDQCTVTMKRKNGFEYTISFSMDDAERAGLVKDGSGWEKYPSNMLRWRAVGYCADVVFPDVIGGMKRADEFGANVTPEGDVVEAEWIKEVEEPEPAGTNLEYLVDTFGADEVLRVLGKIPETQDEIDEVFATLELEAIEELATERKDDEFVPGQDLAAREELMK